MNIACEADVRKSIRTLHSLGPRVVIVTSIDLGEEYCLYGGVKVQDDVVLFKLPLLKLSGCFTGTGDLLAALLTAHIQSDNFR